MINGNYSMTAEELNERILFLLQSSENIQEFADLASPHNNWRLIDKSIKIPSHIGIKEEDCPFCFEPVRMIFEKFQANPIRKKLICPHCNKALICIVEFTGYTGDIYLSEE